MIQYNTHQYIIISIIQYEITRTYIYIKCTIQYMKQKKEIKNKK